MDTLAIFVLYSRTTTTTALTLLRAALLLLARCDEPTAEPPPTVVADALHIAVAPVRTASPPAATNIAAAHEELTPADVEVAPLDPVEPAPAPADAAPARVENARLEVGPVALEEGAPAPVVDLETLRLRTVPAGVEVKSQGRVLGITPLDVHLDGPVMNLVLQRRGYLPRYVRRVPGRRRLPTIYLERRP